MPAERVLCGGPGGGLRFHESSYGNTHVEGTRRQLLPGQGAPCGQNHILSVAVPRPQLTKELDECLQ